MDRAVSVLILVLLVAVGGTASAASYPLPSITAVSEYTITGEYIGRRAGSASQAYLDGRYRIGFMGQTFDATASRVINKSSVVSRILPYAKSFGPWAIGLQVGTILWDAALQRWVVPSPALNDPPSMVNGQYQWLINASTHAPSCTTLLCLQDAWKRQWPGAVHCAIFNYGSEIINADTYIEFREWHALSGCASGGYVLFRGHCKSGYRYTGTPRCLNA